MRFCNPCVVTAGIGGWYPNAVARLLKSFGEKAPDLPVLAWVNTYPLDAPSEPGRLQYTVKPFAMLDAQRQGYDLVVWVDTAFQLIRPIDALIAWIIANKYFLCHNGWKTGTWCSDEALKTLDITREQSFEIPEATSYCIGLDLRTSVCREFLLRWTELAKDGITFYGYHGNTKREHPDRDPQRSEGFVSEDPRVMGHRFDQTAASVLAWKLGMHNLVDRPIFTDYWKEEQDARTILVNRGGS